MVINDKSDGIGEVAETVQTIVNADGSKRECTETIVCEHFLDIIVNEKKAASLVCTPSNLRYLTLGRLHTEGIISGTDDVESIYICESGHTAKVFLVREPIWKKAENTESTCCTGNRMLLENTSGDYLHPLKKTEIEFSHVFNLADEFAAGSKLHGRTKGTHSCYLGVDGKCIFSCEDIGRHNAMDKCIGYMLENNIEPKRCMLFTTGRVPTDMVKKAVAAGVGALVSKAVPTDAAIEMAADYNLNLICRAWPDSCAVANLSK